MNRALRAHVSYKRLISTLLYDIIFGQIRFIIVVCFLYFQTVVLPQGLLGDHSHHSTTSQCSRMRRPGPEVPAARWARLLAEWWTLPTCTPTSTTPTIADRQSPPPSPQTMSISKAHTMETPSMTCELAFIMTTLNYYVSFVIFEWETKSEWFFFYLIFFGYQIL